MTAAPLPRLLVADDEEAILAEYRRVFDAAAQAEPAVAKAFEEELFGGTPAWQAPSFELVTCRQGGEAIEAARSALAAGRPFPVVFLDVRMPPGPSGVETARALRALDPTVQIVIVTGYSDLSPERIVELVPPVDRLFYFEKPFRSVELRQLVTALCAKWHAERALEAARDDLESRVAARTADLLAAKQEAEQANKAKTVFLASMSHEFRTPLNAVIGFSEFMLTETMGPLGQPKYREYVQDIHASATHLLTLINTILDLATADSGRLTLEEERFPVAEAIATALRLVEPEAAKARVRLVNVQPGPTADVTADRTKVMQILINILSNAVKFSPAGSDVRVETTVGADGGLFIRIVDSGIGISPEDIPRALEPFTRLENAQAGKRQGTGLGLPLSTALAQLHGGGLHLDSAVGVGTTVTVTIPPCRVVARGTADRADSRD